MEDKMTVAGAGFRLTYGRMYVNRSMAPEIFYDSNRDPILLKPGEARFEKAMKDADVHKYLLMPELWLAQRKIEEMLAGKESLRILIDMNRIDRFGDAIMMTVFPKAYREVFGSKVKVSVWISQKVFPVWEENPDIENVLVGNISLTGYDAVVDANNLELKWEERRADAMFGYKNRTEIFLENLGIWLVNKKPVLKVPQDELKWALDQVGEKEKPLVGVQLYASVPLKTYPHMSEVMCGLERRGFQVVILDGKYEGNHVFTFKQAVAMASLCNYLIVPDSSFLHVGGALGKRMLALFGNADGKIYTEDYEKCRVLQAPCPQEKPPCWWTAPCVEGQTYQEKEKSAVASCLSGLAPEKVLDEFDALRSGNRKILACMLTFNLLSMTKKAVASIRSKHNVELFVVDNESSDGTPEWLLQEKIPFVSKKMGVANACNVGVRKFLLGKYDHFLLLNNDIVLQRQTIDALVKNIESSGYYGLTAAEAENVSPWLIDSAKPHHKGVALIEDIPASAYSCTMFSRECIEKVGTFDERFFPRYIEDNDFTLRIRLAGGKFGKAGESIFYHVLGGVIKTNEAERLKQDFNWNKNLHIYRDIWGIGPHEPQHLAALHPEQIGNITEVAAKNPNFKIGIRRWMGGIGDHVFLSVVPKALRQRWPSCDITIITKPDLFDIWKHNPYINRVTSGDGHYDILHDFTDYDYAKEMEEMSRYGQIVSSRAEIYLRAVGLPTTDIHPVFFVPENQKEAAREAWPKNGNRARLAVSVQASNKIMTWPHVYQFADFARQSGFSVKFLDEKKNGSFILPFAESAAILSAADIFVGPNTSYSNMAGAMDIPAITLFSYRNGEVMARMFPSMRAIQGVCSVDPKKCYCDYAAPCFGPGNYRGKENIANPKCILSIDPHFILGRVEAYVNGLYGRG